MAFTVKGGDQGILCFTTEDDDDDDEGTADSEVTQPTSRVGSSQSTAETLPRPGMISLLWIPELIPN